MDLTNIFYIQSHFLKLVEPLLQQYFDYDSSMLDDEIQHVVQKSGINCITIKNGIPTINYLKTFYENPKMFFINSDYPFNDIADNFPKYFDLDNEEKKLDTVTV